MWTADLSTGALAEHTSALNVEPRRHNVTVQSQWLRNMRLETGNHTSGRAEQ